MDNEQVLRLIRKFDMAELDKIISEHPDGRTRDYLEEMRSIMSDTLLPSALAHRIADEWSGSDEEVRATLEAVLTEGLSLLPTKRLNDLVGTEVLEDDWDEPIDEWADEDTKERDKTGGEPL